MADVLDAMTSLVNESFPDSNDGTVPESTDTPVETAAAETIPEPEGVKPPEPDEIDKLLEADGIKSSAERENRIPYKRVKKIIENALKKEKELSSKTAGEHTTKLTAAEQELERYRQADTAARTDPDRYMQILSVLNPAFATYKKAQAAAAEAAKLPTFDKSRPAPDTQFTDGTVGYSPEQHEKLLDWVAEKASFDARTSTLAEVEKTYGATVQQIEQERKSAANLQRDVVATQRQQQAYIDIYGEEIKQHYGVLAKELEANNGQNGKPYLAADLVVARFMTAKLNEKITKARETVMNEMNDRSKAAVKTAPTQSKVTIDPDERRDNYDVIDEVLRAQGL